MKQKIQQYTASKDIKWKAFACWNKKRNKVYTSLSMVSGDVDATLLS